VYESGSPLAKTVIGLTTRLIAKVTTHLLKHILRFHYHIEFRPFNAQAISHQRLNIFKLTTLHCPHKAMAV